MSVQCPSYISARSAEVILSDVRPIKLKPDALHAINVLLDEALYSILSTARSLATDRLKAALLKVLPTSLGKEALLEAEVELKAYWDRTGSARSPLSARHGETAAFDLQLSFELLRLKCEAYSTMNDSDEDAEAEKLLQHHMDAAGASSPPTAALLAPAALYLTAILEAICEHVLSNVSRVAARDSSRTLASVQDLYTALGEDNTIYGMFKAMKVFAHIEALSKAQSQRPRRSKSISRSTDKAIVSRTSSSSPLNGESTSHAHTPSTSTVTGTVAGTACASGTARSRVSTESQKSTAVGSSESRGASLEKAKGSRIFHSRTPSDKQHDPANSALARSATENGINRENGIEFEEDDELQQEFDELMRSGATMKVSLTPDRLKSMEVYKQERFERERLSRRGPRGADKPQDGASHTESKLRGAVGTNGRSLRHVDSIVEDEEESGSSTHVSTTAANPLPSPPSSARMRNTSFTATTTTMTTRPASDQRLRSISISNVPHPRDRDGISRKVSNGPRDLLRPGSQNAAPPPTSTLMGPPKTRKKQVNLESMDLDDVLAGLDGEEEFVEVRAPVKTASPTDSPRSPGGSKISKQTQDLIAFLDAGPPEDPTFNPSANASVISFESSRSRSGRLQRMMSRLTLGGSKESLNGSYHMAEDQPPRTPRLTLSRKNSKMAIVSSPPPSFKSASLQSKRSIPNVNGAVYPATNGTAYPSVIVATPPPRPSVYTQPQAIPQPVSTSSSTSNEDAPSSQPSTLSRRNTRKAVPAIDGAVSPASSNGHDSGTDSRPPTNGSVSVNGHRTAHVYDDSKLASSPSPVRRAAVVDGHGHPVKLDTSTSTSEGSLRVMSADRKSFRPKAESRSVSRSPAPPPPPPPQPTIAPGDADEMRRLLGAATSADECRLVVDLFLVKSGFPLKEPAPEAVAAAALGGGEGEGEGKGKGEGEAVKKLEDAMAARAAEEAEVERGQGERSSSPSPRSSSTTGLTLTGPQPPFPFPPPTPPQPQPQPQSRPRPQLRGPRPPQSPSQNQSQSGGQGQGRDQRTSSSSNSSSRTFGSPVPFPAPTSVTPDPGPGPVSLSGVPTILAAPAPAVDRRLSVIVPRTSVDLHVVNLYRIYQKGLDLDRTGA